MFVRKVAGVLGGFALAGAGVWSLASSSDLGATFTGIEVLQIVGGVFLALAAFLSR